MQTGVCVLFDWRSSAYMVVSCYSAFLHHANRNPCTIERMLDDVAVGTDGENRVWLWGGRGVQEVSEYFSDQIVEHLQRHPDVSEGER